MAKRIPNRIKFAFVSSTNAKIEGTLECSDAGWTKIFDILMEEVSAARRKRAAQPNIQEAGNAEG